MFASSLRRNLGRSLAYPARALDALRPGIRILMYHRIDAPKSFDQLAVSPDAFRRQLDCLVKRHQP